MTLEERAQCIADLAAPGLAARGAERQRRIYERALMMLRAVQAESSLPGSEAGERRRQPSATFRKERADAAVPAKDGDQPPIRSTVA